MNIGTRELIERCKADAWSACRASSLDARRAAERRWDANTDELRRRQLGGDPDADKYLTDLAEAMSSRDEQ